jgi:hypothetical protein
METDSTPKEITAFTQQDSGSSDELTASQKKTLITIIVIVVVLVIGIIAGIWLLVQPSTDTARVRDIFIIFMAFESLLIGFTLVILIVQLARLINLLQNEIKPIIDSTNETVSNLRGTAAFLSDSLSEPVIKLNEYLAGLSELFKVIGLARKRPKPKAPERSEKHV